MTKLTEWIVFAGLAFSIWITLLMDILPLKVSNKAKEMIWPVRSQDVLQKLYIIKKSFATTHQLSGLLELIIPLSDPLS